MASNISPFFDSGPVARANSLAFIQLSRDRFEPVYLEDSKAAQDGYAEGAVLNTRFGSFPHSTIINQPWGSQIRASDVDTGSRGRKRKRHGNKDQDDGAPSDEEFAGVADTEATGGSVKEAVTASSGFVFLLQPTPELWTASLPHRTQVVYLPDYSYILHRIRARPGARLIEAGAGSGSFTHAAARAVYSGYPTSETDRKGKVFSFEFNAERCEKMKEDITQHCLDGVVQITHRDVYSNGFHVDGKSPEAEAVFLDLPAPWDALPQLSRSRPTTIAGDESLSAESDVQEWVSPLNPKTSVYICTFSPCIEQVTRTVSAMRRLGWRDIDTVEIAHRKMIAYRERIGLDYVDARGVIPVPRDVDEAVTRLRDIEEKNLKNRNGLLQDGDGAYGDGKGEERVFGGKPAAKKTTPARTWMQGRLETRSEPELRTHTSYLVFAILPREWTEEDEAEAAAKWPCGSEQVVIQGMDRRSRKEARREIMAKQKDLPNP